MESFFSTLLNMSMTASIVIICVILARIFLKKAPKLFSYSLWSIVLFRLVCPFSFESVLSLIPKKVSIPLKNFNPPTVSAPVYVPTDTINHAISSAPQMEQTTASLMSVFMIIWAIGIFALLFYSAVSYLSLKIKVCTATKLENNIFECETVTSPFVLGIIKPKIYLPLNLSDEQKHYILKHEQTHIKRFDYIIKPVSFLVLCMHWFNPLVWLAFALMSKDMELSCDEAVLKQLGNDIKKDYSASLLSFATSKKMLNGSPLAFGESNVKARIKNVLNYKKPAFWVIIVAVIAVVAVGIGLASNPKEVIKSAGTSGIDSLILEIDYDNKTMLVEGIGENSVIGDKCRVDCKNADFIEVDGDKIKPINITDFKVSEHIILNINEVAESYPTKTSATTVQKNQADTQIGKPVKNKIMAQAKLENGYELQLVLVNGRSFLGEEAGMSAYTHKTNFQGEYEIRTIKNDKIVSKITKELQKAILWDGVNLNFDKEFAFALDDYNGDGNIDFSIGQPLGSNGNIYLLFSVDNKGNLSILTVNTDLFAASHEFSKKFDKISDTAFSFIQYDNSIAQEIKYIATWNDKSFDVEKAKSAYFIEVMKNGDMQLSINDTSDFAEFGKRNEGFAYYEKEKKQLHIGIITDIGQPTATDESPVGSLAGAGVKFDYDIENKKLIFKKFSAGDKDKKLRISDMRLIEIANNLSDIMKSLSVKTQNIGKENPEKTPTPQEFLDEIAKSFLIKNGNASFKIPAAMPNGYELSELSVYVSGLMPMGNDSNMSLHAFEKEDEERKWELSKEYSEKMFEGNPPDKTQINASFYLFEKGTNRSDHYKTVSKIFPLRDDTFTQSIKVQSNEQNQSVTFTNQFNDKLIVECVLPKDISFVDLKSEDNAAYNSMMMSNINGSNIVSIYAKDVKIGELSYSDFEYIPDAEEKKTAIYQGIMLGAFSNWGEDYTVIGTSKNGSTATCRPLFHTSDGGLNPVDIYSKGILSYDRILGKFIAMEFNEKSITDEQWLSIAKSIKLSGKIEK